MNMPEFSAETSLRGSSEAYWAGAAYTSAGDSSVGPAQFEASPIQPIQARPHFKVRLTQFPHNCGWCRLDPVTWRWSQTCCTPRGGCWTQACHPF